MVWQSKSELVNLSETPKVTFYDLATLTFDYDYQIFLGSDN